MPHAISANNMRDLFERTAISINLQSKEGKHFYISINDFYYFIFRIVWSHPHVLFFKLKRKLIFINGFQFVILSFIRLFHQLSGCFFYKTICHFLIFETFFWSFLFQWLTANERIVTSSAGYPSPTFTQGAASSRAAGLICLICY